MTMVQRATAAGGRIAPIVIPPEHLPSPTGLMNPSVFIDDDGDILVNLRHVNYTLYHSEYSQKFPSYWGPLAYLHPEKDLRLVTTNYICRLNDKLEVSDYAQVQMMELHEPIWEFVGLEDARLVQWNGEYNLIGVRRDTTTNGQGRMEISTIDLDKKLWTAKEVNRERMPAPGADDSYCEKNWVPILDRPQSMVKWTLPTEVVSYAVGEAVSTMVDETPWAGKDQRGSSQVVPFGDYYLSVTHEVDLFKNYLGQKDAIYRHRVILWDRATWKLIGASEPFSFLDARIEFCVGAAKYKSGLILSFGFQDNAAFILEVPESVVNEIIEEIVNVSAK